MKKRQLINYLFVVVCFIATIPQSIAQSTHSGFTLSTSVTSSCGSVTGKVIVNINNTFPGSGFIYLQKSTNRVNWTQINPALGEVLFDVNPTNMSFQYHFSGVTQNTYYRAVNGIYITNSNLVTVNNAGSPSAGTIQGLGNGKFCSYANVNLTLQNYGYSNTSLNNSVNITWKAKPVDLPNSYVTIASGASCSFAAGDYTKVYAEVKYTTCGYTSTTPVASIQAYHLSGAGSISSSFRELCTASPNNFTLTSSVNTNDFSIIKWQRSANNGQTWADISHTSRVLNVTPASLNAGTTYSYRLVATHKTYMGCNPVYSSSVNIATRNTAPNSIDVGKVNSTKNTLCANSSDNTLLYFNHNNSSYRVIKWQRSANNGQTWADINHTSVNLSVTANDLNAGTNYLYRVASEHIHYRGCTPLYSASTSIQVKPLPDVPIASQPVFTRFGAGPITVSVNPNPNINSYEWVGYPSVIKGSSLALDYVGSSRSIQVKGANSGGCTSTSTTIQVKIMPLPVLHTSWKYQTNGNVLHTMWVASIYDSYQWFKDDLPIGGATQASYETSVVGRYKLRVVYKGATYDLIKIIEGNATISPNKLNKVQEDVVRVKGIINANNVEALSIVNGQKSQTINYLDGLGRPWQTVQVAAAPNQHDVIQGVVYDKLSRSTRGLLPYVIQNVNAGNARSNVLAELFGFYQNTPSVATTTYPYSLQEVENSPLNRVLQTFAPGNSWVGAGKGVTTNVWTNPDPNNSSTANSDKIRILTVNNVAASADIIISQDEVVLSAPTSKTLHQVRQKVVLSEGFSMSENEPTITFEINQGDRNRPEVTGYYAANELSRVRVTDEDGKPSEEFKNKSGQVILKRAKVDANTWAQTYYAYNDLGQLSYVLPPEAVKALDAANWDFAVAYGQVAKLWYRYYYDARGRLIVKEVPGAGKVMMVYDKRDRLVLSQDANQRLEDKWSFTKYDQLNRPVITGMHTNSQSRQDLQTTLDAQFGNAGYASHETFDLTGTHLYSNVSFPTAQLDVHSVTYYDNYAWKNGNTAYDYSVATLDSQLATEPVTYQTQGQVTATKTAVLDSYGTRTGWLTTVSYYDTRGRVLQTIADNNKGGKDRTMTQYAFDGRVLQSIVQHQTAAPAATYYVSQWTQYDHTGRVLATFQEIADSYTYRDVATAATLATTQPATSVTKVSSLAYNEIGQLITKELGKKQSANEPLQTLNFRYNIRGWMTHLNDAGLSTQGSDGDIFGFELKYDQGATNNYLNGNIGRMVWQSSIDNVQRQYDYTYDMLNRLKTAKYSASDPTENGRYDVGNLSYDLNGNILTLKREGLLERDLNLAKTFGTIDQLSYTYAGNQLLGVADAEDSRNTGVAGDFRDGHTATTQNPDYRYDANGNMVADQNKGIVSIVYNHLNLPTIINFEKNQQIVYTYDAAGIKLNKVVYDSTGAQLSRTDYVGSFVYENDALQFVHTGEGRALAPGTLAGNADFVYEYHYKDHLGNLRVAFREGQAQTTQATLEDVTVDKQQGFEYDAVVRNTKPTGNGHAAKLGGETQLLGPWKTLKVTKGDQVKAEVYAHISGASSQNTASNLNLFVGTLANAYNSSGETNSNNPNVLQVGVSFTPNNPSSQSSGLPNAYLRYVLYDETGTRAIRSGRVFVTSAAHTSWEKLEFEYEVPENGLLQVYTANETETQNVWFDDLKVDFTPQLIVQENHYYPFGMNLAGIEKVGKPEHRFQYNGVEKEQSFGLNWNETRFRSYDLQLGRWHQIDPKNSERESPYVGMGNNPVFFEDSKGDTVRIKHIVSFDHETGDYKVADGHMNPAGSIQLGIFVHTPEGREIIGRYANVGDVIGGIEFKKDGKYSKHTLIISEYNDEGTNVNGRTIPGYKKDKKRGKTTVTASFLIQINLAPHLKEDPLIVSMVYGHEFFLHLDGSDNDFVKAAESKDAKQMRKVYADHRENVHSDKDHSNFATSGNAKFSAYMKSLGKFFLYSPEETKSLEQSERRRYQKRKMQRKK